jgi:hypothetical protein
MKLEGLGGSSGQLDARPAPPGAVPDRPGAMTGDRLKLTRDGASEGRPLTRREWARQFQKGFNRGATAEETMIAGGFFGGMIGGGMLAYGLTTAGVAAAVPIIGGVLAVGSLALLGYGLWKRFGQN